MSETSRNAECDFEGLPCEVQRGVLELRSDFLLLLEPDGRVRWWGEGAREFLGGGHEPARSFAELAHPDDRERTQRALGGWAAGRGNAAPILENRVRTHGGRVRPVAWSITPVREGERVTGLLCLGRDITPQKQYENALMESDARHRALLKGVHDPLITIDLNGLIQSASDSVEPVFGYRPDELVGRNIRVLLPEPYRSEHDGYLETYRATRVTNILGTTREFTVVHKSGEELPIELSVARVDIPGQAEPLFTGSFRDIRRRKAAEAALREREQRLRAIFDQEFQLVGLLDAAGTLLETNRASLSLVGCKREDVVGRFYPDTPWWQGSEASRQRLIEAIPRVLAGGFERFEVEHTDRSGVVHVIDFSLKPVFDADGNVTHMIPEGRDISELKRVQESEHQLLRALAEVGESAAVMAHEIKNPITAVNFALKAVADRLGEDSREVIEDLSDRMQHLERKLRGTLSFVRPLDLHPQRVETRELLGRVQALLKAEMTRAQVTLELDARSPDLAFQADRARVEDVLVNLVRNASQAVGAGGRVVVSCRPAEPGQVELVVDDDGPGIPEDKRAHLFKPFVTTRSEGTGLGLAICRRIVEAHGGRVAIQDGPLGGARFVVRLPRRCRD
ncbi:MAG: PAS domain S-box protein [Planctomycetes bacterium]|nr:PAS domain S-box protein [Planctomycetota bacterium]